MSEHVLPDSRLSRRPDLGSKMVLWRGPGGSAVRLEAVIVYCANCGVEYGWVPRENTTFAFWLCKDCYQKWGHLVGTYAMPDEEWSAAVRHELQAKFGGRDATVEEILLLAEQGELGPALEALARDSPIPGPDKRAP